MLSRPRAFDLVLLFLLACYAVCLALPVDIEGSGLSELEANNVTLEVGDLDVDDQCPGNSSWVQCSSHCEPACGASLPPTCDPGCGEPRCQCDQGFRRDLNDTCVLLC